MSRYWFKPKSYGYGYVPISLEGWSVTLLLIALGLLLAYSNNFFNPFAVTFQRSLLFIAEIMILGFAFLKLFEKRCKGKLKWNWGK